MMAVACLMASAMAGGAMGSGLWAARSAFGLLLWLGWLLGGGGREGVLLFKVGEGGAFSQFLLHLNWLIILAYIGVSYGHL